MNVSTIVHIIGSLALITVLFTVILYTSIRTNSLIYENEKKTLQNIVNSLSYQILTMYIVETNNSVFPNYPLEALYGRKYNVIIANGGKINELYKHITGLNTSYIYVLAIDPGNNNYAYAVLLMNSSDKPVYIKEFTSGRSCSSNGYILFSSETIVYIWKYEYINYISMSCELKGLKTK